MSASFINELAFFEVILLLVSLSPIVPFFSKRVFVFPTQLIYFTTFDSFLVFAREFAVFIILLDSHFESAPSVFSIL